MANRDDSAIVKKAWLSRKRKGKGSKGGGAMGKAAAAAVALQFQEHHPKPGKSILQKALEKKKKRIAMEKAMELAQGTRPRKPKPAPKPKAVPKAKAPPKPKAKTKNELRAEKTKARRAKARAGRIAVGGIEHSPKRKKAKSPRKVAPKPVIRKAGETREERNLRFAAERKQRALAMRENPPKAPKMTQAKRTASSRRKAESGLVTAERAVVSAGRRLREAKLRAIRIPYNDPRNEQADLAVVEAEREQKRRKKDLDRAKLLVRRYKPRQ